MKIGTHISFFCFLALTLTTLVFSVENENEKEFMKRCPPFRCGKLGNISFPFAKSSEEFKCGLFAVDDCDKEQPKMKLSWESDKWFQLHNISEYQLFGNKWNNFTITDTDLQKLFKSKDCHSIKQFSPPLLQFPGSVRYPKYIELIKCNRSLAHVPFHFEKEYKECPDFHIYYNHTLESTRLTIPPNCTTVSLPVHPSMSFKSHRDLFELLTATVTFEVFITVDCYLCPFKDGQCQKNPQGEWRCLNNVGKEIDFFPQHAKNTGGMMKAITAAAPAAGILVLLIFTLWFLRRRCLSDGILCRETRTHDCQNIEDFLRSHGQLVLKRYRYSQVKKMTGMFKEKLGEGGYGGVFKGELPNGCLVAVKLLKESKSNGEEFINEVATISRTSHINIVTLLGFCFEGSKRALIYEFITNGSLEKYVCKKNALEANQRLGWDKLFDIAVGVAQGLEYLHRGCNTRILHFDIKPHNILLDENFCPKISDFGLAKICTKKESIVSMIEARGTIGYIAPEVFCRNFGGVSHKSDVYSYGMLVLDIVGGRKNIFVEVDNSSEMYFPDWIYKSLVRDGVDEVDDQIAKKMMMVTMWCIQAMPSTRPTMSRVVEMLQGSLELLPIPPKPNLSSPSKSILPSLAESSSISIITS